MIGELLGNYRLDRVIGDGGMGRVYLAHHTLLDRPAAIKVLHAEFADSGELLERFFREAVVTSKINHPGIVEVYDYGVSADGVAYLVMELLDGESLESRIDRRGDADVVSIAFQLASVLQATHDISVVHRDLKPSNIVLVADELAPGGERVKVLDFGIAKVLAPSFDPELTAKGTLLGTPPYMSPEQCMAGEELGPKSDIYSLGCVLYELITNKPPFDLVEIADFIFAHTERIADPLPADDALGPVPELVNQMLSKRPSERPSAARIRRKLAATVTDDASAGDDETTIKAAPTADPLHTTIPDFDQAETTEAARDLEAETIKREPERRPARVTRLILVAVLIVIAALAIGLSLWETGDPELLRDPR